MDPKSADYILLKWGSLKGWHLTNARSFELVKKYFELGVSMSAMLQEDTPEQKALLRELILNHTGTITNDWDGEEYTKERALDYLDNYGKPTTPNHGS